MRMINPNSLRLNVALAGGLRTFKHWNGVRILVVVPRLLTVVLWVSVQQVGQTQGAVPAQPTGLTAAAGDGQATLTWDEPSDSSITGSEYLQAQAAKLTAPDGAFDDRFQGVLRDNPLFQPIRQIPWGTGCPVHCGVSPHSNIFAKIPHSPQRSPGTGTSSRSCTLAENVH